MIKKYKTYKLLLPDLTNINIYKIFPRSNRFYIKPNNINKELVIYGSNLESSLGIKQYTQIVRNMIQIPNNILYPLVGLIISDGYIEYSSKLNLNNSIFNKSFDINNINYINGLLTKHNCRFRFKQSIIHMEYLLYVYNILSHYCISSPFIKDSRLKGKIFKQIEFITMALPCFSILRRLFYKGRIKVIPSNIYDLFNYESLAHVIMCDGSFTNKGIVLNLQNYTSKELCTLINLFYIKFNISSTLHKSRNQFVIYLPVKSVKLIYPHIYPYIIDSMKYKIEGKIIYK